MKRLRYPLFAALLLGGLAAAGRYHAPDTPSQMRAVPGPEKQVLRLSYRGEVENRSPDPHRIGLFYTGTYLHCADLMGTDREGSIYLLDPLRYKTCVLKCFDRQGRLREAWNPLGVYHGSAVTVTERGYIWTGLNGEENGAGLPVVVYRQGKKAPVVDWRRKLPAALAAAVQKALQEKGLAWKDNKYWSTVGLESGAGQVAVRLSSEVVGEEMQIARILWIRVSEDGSRIVDVKVASDWWGEETPILAPDGSLWARASDLSLETHTWSKVWLWEKGKGRGEPLIDRTVEEAPWKDILALDKARLPTIRLDGRGNIYLVFTRDDVRTRPRRFRIDGQVYDRLHRVAEERAVLVLDRRRGVIGYHPWVPTSVEIQDSWVKPLPDGSGFYRIQFLEEETRVYFHPLPK
jgi:hypothetical protein